MKNLVIAMTELVQTRNSKPITTSLKIAEVFGKRHDNVLKDIQNLNIPRCFSLLNFKEINYTDKQGRMQKAFEVTKNGFSLLAFGYNGVKAMQFKVAYINAFDAMEQTLMEQRISKEKKYFDRKAELYKQKHKAETENKSIWTWFYNTKQGKQMQTNDDNLKKIKAEIADMDRKEFGYTHNLFSMLEENKEL